MSGQLRTLKKRIKSIESTKKITRAMEMVSASKLKRFQNLLDQASPYAESLWRMIGRLITSNPGFHHPLLAERPEQRNALLVITSDAGLCGSYNNDVVNEARRFLRSSAYSQVEQVQTSYPLKTSAEGHRLMIGFGKNGVNALTRLGYTFSKHFIDVKAPDLEHAIKRIELILEAEFREHRIDAVYVTRAKFVSKSQYKAVTEKILPLQIEKPEATEDEEPASEAPYILEPSAEFLFTKLIPFAFEAKVREMFLEAFVAEQSARMTAMHQATENAAELIDALVLLRNKIRQAAITKELIEIVSGSRALKTQ
jgi:F-type H+-transporting ATPase subunit gamma